MPKLSVILSTYNAEAWLEKVLWGYCCQTFKDFEIVIADDGSGPKTKLLIEAFKKDYNLDINHVWQEDDGFQKSRILNKAIVAAKSDYIVMSDGDCIPRADFLEIHNTFKEPGCFLSGGYFMLPMDISIKIDKNDVFNANCFNVKWLKDNGLSSSFKNNKLRSKGFKSQVLNLITPTKPSWNGHNASGWKKDIVAINGFDERMQYGGQDRELGERLVNYGIKPKQIRYSAICIHLDHKRGYKTPESINKNLAIRATTRKEKLKTTAFGIHKNH
ncbi:glycosyltransferase family 2 protein [Algibacter pectinivorans]|uniref:Glycosyltransferase involved in cell wall bisynthesis n=1 Tax=Algibacter pectinivorans TaxID=870482 RepID=A0A1I1RDQ5_9FLAO|nr:glycosyltransferase family 2 protein [Algibacter pectinivorans]SFD32484.1 Glycosyltransferase involved in cell wall bisynthesis [Algibacter pectinivorans]